MCSNPCFDNQRITLKYLSYSENNNIFVIMVKKIKNKKSKKLKKWFSKKSWKNRPKNFEKIFFKKMCSNPNFDFK